MPVTLRPGRSLAIFVKLAASEATARVHCGQSQSAPFLSEFGRRNDSTGGYLREKMVS